MTDDRLPKFLRSGACVTAHFFEYNEGVAHRRVNHVEEEAQVIRVLCTVVDLVAFLELVGKIDTSHVIIVHLHHDGNIDLLTILVALLSPLFCG